MAQKKQPPPTPPEEGDRWELDGYALYVVGPKLEKGSPPARDMLNEDGQLVVFLDEEDARKVTYRKRKLVVYQVIIKSARPVR